MDCSCGKPARHVVEDAGGGTRALCDACFEFEELLRRIDGLLGSDEHQVAVEACPVCGTPAQRIAKEGRVGCAACYGLEEARQLVARIHGTLRYEGPRSLVTPESRLRRLRRELQEALEREDYRRAAALRREMEHLEGGKPQ